MDGRTMGSWRRTRLAAALLAGLAVAACRGDGERERGGEVVAEGWRPVTGEVRGVPVAELQSALRTRLEGGERPPAVTEGQWRRVRELYGAYGQSPLFLGPDGLDDRARVVVAAVTETHTDALRPSEYPLAELHEALRAVQERRPSAEQLAAADLMLTATYVAYAEDMLTGQLDPRAISQSWHINPNTVDVDSAVARVMRDARFDQAVARLRPQDESYALLRQELERYRGLVARGGWQPVPTGPSVKPGEPAPLERLRALEARLSVEGLLESRVPTDSAAVPPSSPGARERIARGDTGAARDTSAGAGRRAARPPRAPRPGEGVYDERLAGAVAQFQARHGIVVDSILGEETVNSMNVPAEYRLRQLAANLERHRWLPHALGSRYILVNVPAFRLQAFEGGRAALTMNVVVGAEFEDQSTPTFADSMSYVVFRPYWNVPDSIAIKEIYPEAQRDPGYFARKRYEEVTENGKTRVRQKPGDDNALGLVKFMFPNQFAIYLHDTPEKETFKQDIRAASHGCIRLEKPGELAQWVLGWDGERVRQAMESGQDDQRVDLTQKIPVYIAYFTAYARDGQLYFGNDVYNRDEAIVQAMADAAQPDADALRTMQELRALLKL